MQLGSGVVMRIRDGSDLVGLVREMTYFFFRKISGCDLCKQGLMGADIFNASIVNKVMGVGLVKSTPNYIFVRRRERRIRLRMRRRWVINLGSIWIISYVREYLTFYGQGL